MDKILDTHSDEVGITVRWYVLADKKDDKRTIAAEYMLQHLLEVFRKIDTLERSRYTRKMLHEWFESMDLEIFSKKYTTRDYTYVTNALRYQEEWCKRSNIESTPTIFINGFELPRQYTRNDLPEMITRLIEKGPEDKLFIA